DQADKFPDFVEADYTWPDANWMAPYGWGMGGVMWPMGGDYGGYPLDPGARTADMPNEVAQRAQQQDLENAIVGEGSEVMARGGEKLGEVHNMVIDPTSHKPSSVVVRSGLIFTEDVEIPGDWVASYDDRVVTLNVDKPTVEHLADSQQNDKATLSAAGAKDVRQA
ncbi:MAG: PRC-barrel domain-containing protein, partial [Chloroflexota bacterium]